MRFFIIFAVGIGLFAKKQYISNPKSQSTISNLKFQIYLMYTKQLSIFLENKSGRLTEVTEILAAAGINLCAMSIADSSDFGILRCVVSDPQAACKTLRNEGFAVKVTDVIGFVTDNVMGSLANILKHLSDEGVEIEYMYSFNNGDVANVIIKTVDMEACHRILTDNNVTLLTDEQMYSL